MLKNILSIKLLICIIIAGNFAGNEAIAQDPQFSQFYANPLYLNPAFAGTGRCPRVHMNYRNQWPGLSGTFITHSASYDQHIDAISGGFGLLVTNDRAGGNILNTTNASAIYAYQLPVSRNLSLKAGFQATYMQKSVDWNKLTFGDMIDPRRGFIYNTNEIPITEPVNTVDFSAGLLAFSKTYYIGAAVHHLAEPDESLTSGGTGSPLPRKITGHAGIIIPLEGQSDESYLSPNVLYMNQQNYQQFLVGLYASKGPLVGGLWYRHTPKNAESAIILLGIHHNIFKFGYSYDVTVSNLSVSRTYGAHEFSLGMQFYCKPKKKKFRTISCPSF